MTELPAVDTIIEDIEFELLLGVVPAGEIGEALTAIRREQNRLRREYAATRRRVDSRDLAGALLRLNDLVLDVLNEMLSRLASVESSMTRGAGPERAREDADGTSREVEAVEPAGARRAPDMSPDVDLEVAPIALPLIGKLVDRLRLALHRIAVYYVRRLGQQQGAVNVYQAGELAQLRQLVREQQRRMAALEAEVGRLRAQVSTDGPERDASGEDG